MRILAVFKFKFEFNSDRILICRPVMHGCTCHARILTYRPVSHGCTCQYPHLRPVMHGCTCQDPHLQTCHAWLHLPGSSPIDLSHMAAPAWILTYRPVSHGCTCQNPHLQICLTWLHLPESSPTDLSHMAAPAWIFTYRPVSHGCTCQYPHLQPVMHGCTCLDPCLMLTVKELLGSTGHTRHPIMTNSQCYRRIKLQLYLKVTLP